MDTERDVTRIVRSWLSTDEHETADRVLDTVLARLDTTRQRRSWWPARRTADMNTYAKLGIATAAVVVVAVVGINLMPGSGGTGGSGPAASPSPSPSPSPAPTATLPPTPSPTPAALFPSLGPLAAGAHRVVIDGVPLSFSVPASGWRADGPGNAVVKGEYGQPDGLAIVLWGSAPENVYSDPCAHTPLSPPPSATAAGLAAAVAAIPGTDLVTGPLTIEVGGRPAQRVVITIREDLGCDPTTAYLWYDESSGGAHGGWRFAGNLGQTFTVWIVDVGGTLIWIDGETFKGAGAKPGQQIQQFVDSIRFE